MSIMQYFNLDGAPLPLAWDPSWTFPGTWFDPSDASTVFVGRTGTVPATAGDPVGQIKDKSGKGNHAVAPTDAARPTLARMPKTGRRNLLTYTEDALVSAWTKSNVTALNLSGGVIRFRENPSNTTHSLQQRHIYPAVRTLNIDARFISGGSPRLLGIECRVGTAFNLIFINLATGAVIGAASNISVTTTQLQEGWWNIVAKYSVEPPADTNFAFFTAVGATLASLTYQGDGVSGLELRNLQSEAGTIVTPYQKVTNAFDVTEAGVPDVWSLEFDGVDDVLMYSVTGWPSTSEVYWAGSSEAMANGGVTGLGAQFNTAAVRFGTLKTTNNITASAPTQDSRADAVTIGDFRNKSVWGASANQLKIELVKNGATIASAVPSENLGTTRAGNIIIAGNSYATSFYGGVILKRNVSLTERTLLSKYLSDKAGITL